MMREHPNKATSILYLLYDNFKQYHSVIHTYIGQYMSKNGIIQHKQAFPPSHPSPQERASLGTSTSIN